MSTTAALRSSVIRSHRLPFGPCLLPIVLALPGCGGGGNSPTAFSTPQPTPRPQTVLTILSGEHEEPVAGAVVAVGGGHLKTDSIGHVTLPDSARKGDPLDILAARLLRSADHGSIELEHGGAVATA